jgi:hypothetical protein
MVDNGLLWKHSMLKMGNEGGGEVLPGEVLDWEEELVGVGQ